MTMNVTFAPSRPSLKFSLEAGSQRIVGYHDGGAASATDPSDSSEPSDMAAIISARTGLTVPHERAAEQPIRDRVPRQRAHVWRPSRLRAPQGQTAAMSFSPPR